MSARCTTVKGSVSSAFASFEKWLSQHRLVTCLGQGCSSCEPILVRDTWFSNGTCLSEEGSGVSRRHGVLCFWLISLVLVNKSWVLPISRICRGDGGWPAEDGCGGFLGGSEGGGLVVAGDAEGTPTADFAAAEVEAVSADRLLPLAYDAPQGGAALALCLSAHAAVVSGLLELGEECTGPIGELFAAAEVDGALVSGDPVGNAIVGAVADGAACAVACDDGTDMGEDVGVVADEL